MISIDRAGIQAPTTLTNDVDAEYRALAVKAANGSLKRTDFNGARYSSKEVRSLLWEKQHHKCCFCEHSYEKKFGTVEHFRPKTSVKRAKGLPPTLGYWWLAYEIENLYFACSNCNSTKSTWFPLEAGAAPLMPRESPSDREENPLLLDPGRDKPEDHLVFVKLPGGRYQIAPRNGSPRGKETIHRLNLDRDDLSELRADFLREILPLLNRFREAVTAHDVAGEAQARKEARDVVKPNRRFSLLARAVLAEML